MGQRDSATDNREFPFDLSTTVPANTPIGSPVTERVEVPYNGIITSVFVGFTAGANQSVGMQLGTGAGELWIPRDVGTGADYIGLDNKTIEVELNVAVNEDGPIVARFVNNDPNNAHFVNVIPLVREMN